MEGSSLQLNPSTGLMGFLRHWMVSMHDDLRRTGHWLKSSWRWLHEMSISSKRLLVLSGGCICLYHVWPCSSARCRVYSWRSGMILTLRVLSCWLAHVGLRVCSRVISSLLRPLEFCTEIRVRKIWKIWRCEIVLLCVGSEARVLCYCATDDVFSSSLHSFMVLSHCLL